MGNSHEGSADIDTYVHPRLGNIRRIQEPSLNQFLQYEVVLQNQRIYEDWLKELRYIKTQDAVEEILLLPVEQSFRQTTYCGTGGIATLRFEDYLYSLYPEIQNRREIKRPFNEQELLYLFYNLVKIEAVLEGKNRVIGDVKPQNIIVNEDGYVKVISQFSWPGQGFKGIGGWDKHSQRIFYTAPQECEERLKRRESLMDHLHVNQSQVFSIAMTTLEAGTLRDCSEIYGVTNQIRFNEAKVREFLDIFESRYSKQFSTLLKEMLHPNPRKRWKADRVYNLLKSREYQILNLQQITIRIETKDQIPRVERQEKISIKKIGQSQYSQNPSQHFSTAKFTAQRNAQKNSLQQNLNHSGSYSQSNSSQNGGYNIPVMLQQQTSQRQSLMHPNGLVNPSMQSGAFQPLNGSMINPLNAYPLQQSGYRLVNEYSNFGRPLVPNPNYQQPKQHFRRGNMGQSLPINLQDCELNQTQPHYITQNSMMIHPNKPMMQSYFPQSNRIKR